MLLAGLSSRDSGLPGDARHALDALETHGAGRAWDAIHATGAVGTRDALRAQLPSTAGLSFGTDGTTGTQLSFVPRKAVRTCNALVSLRACGSSGAPVTRDTSEALGARQAGVSCVALPALEASDARGSRRALRAQSPRRAPVASLTALPGHANVSRDARLSRGSGLTQLPSSAQFSLLALGPCSSGEARQPVGTLLSWGTVATGLSLLAIESGHAVPPVLARHTRLSARPGHSRGSFGTRSAKVTLGATESVWAPLASVTHFPRGSWDPQRPSESDGTPIPGGPGRPRQTSKSPRPLQPYSAWDASGPGGARITLLAILADLSLLPFVAGGPLEPWHSWGPRRAWGADGRALQVSGAFREDPWVTRGSRRSRGAREAR